MSDNIAVIIAPKNSEEHLQQFPLIGETSAKQKSQPHGRLTGAPWLHAQPGGLPAPTASQPAAACLPAKWGNCQNRKTVRDSFPDYINCLYTSEQDIKAKEINNPLIDTKF
ncbi:hypothetical protein DSO57_1030215 [Entomophthora muscae]|uniref:Uncharacterized protein n=1 Tax=Entomophthora muscae TaxID=34485 RepID=A0ACC2TMV7_9FUNG|nr:hypothetical protein DSO57_1030215 [Entomophthora muscae]